MNFFIRLVFSFFPSATLVAETVRGHRGVRNAASDFCRSLHRRLQWIGLKGWRVGGSRQYRLACHRQARVNLDIWRTDEISNLYYLDACDCLSVGAGGGGGPAGFL
jgi:hypothetical protein